jgi:hypothetical protein
MEIISAALPPSDFHPSTKLVAINFPRSKEISVRAIEK